MAASVREPSDRGCRVLPEVVETLELRRSRLRMSRRREGWAVSMRRM